MSEHATAETALPLARVYVRRGKNGQERIVAVRIEEGMDQMTLFDLGMALDGNQAVVTVRAAEDQSICEVLYEFEGRLIETMAEMGFRAVFG